MTEQEREMRNVIDDYSSELVDDFDRLLLRSDRLEEALAEMELWQKAYQEHTDLLNEAIQKVAAAGRFPNGWKQPTFLNVEEDGSLAMEFFIGDDRLTFVWDPEEGAMTIKTACNDQEVVEGKKAALFLAKELEAEAKLTKDQG